VIFLNKSPKYRRIRNAEVTGSIPVPSTTLFSLFFPISLTNLQKCPAMFEAGH